MRRASSKLRSVYCTAAVRPWYRWPWWSPKPDLMPVRLRLRQFIRSGNGGQNGRAEQAGGTTADTIFSSDLAEMWAILVD